MSLAKKYNFSDFTIKNYRNLLILALHQRSFRFFTDELKDNTILLRHDVEFSIAIAQKMAEIESELGIRGTYFIQLHSEFYNALEKNTVQSINQIIKLGHQIGLHFDSHYWNIESENELENNIITDKQTLEKYTGANVKVFSFHNNTSFTLSCRKNSYGGLLNVYSNYFRNNFGYNSDSLGYWRFERLEDRLNDLKVKNLQILIHDGMWQDEILPPKRRVYKVIDTNAERLKNQYDAFLNKIGEKNIDWNEVK